MAKPHKLADGRYECQNCLRKFTKNAKTYKDPLFCCNTCRYEFHHQGGQSLKRLESTIRRIVRDELRVVAEEARA
jgi:ribosomal protein L37AE/L43A